MCVNACLCAHMHLCGAHMHACVRTCMPVCVHACICLCAYMHVYVLHACVRTCMSVFITMCMLVCIHECLVHIHPCLCVYMHVCAYAENLYTVLSFPNKKQSHFNLLCALIWFLNTGIHHWFGIGFDAVLQGSH